MSADADHWWRNRREASVNSADAWSGGAKAYRRWMGTEPARDGQAPAQASPTGAVGAAERTVPPDPAPADAERPAAADASERPGPPNPRAAVRWMRPARRVRRRWRAPALAGAGLAAVVSLAPLAWAGRLDPCAAAEVALVEKALSLDGLLAANRVRVANWTGPDGRPLSHGRVGRQIAAEEYAGWPTAAGCTALFWRARWEARRPAGSRPS